MVACRLPHPCRPPASILQHRPDRTLRTRNREREPKQNRRLRCEEQVRRSVSSPSLPLLPRFFAPTHSHNRSMPRALTRPFTFSSLLLYLHSIEIINQRTLILPSNQVFVRRRTLFLASASATASASTPTILHRFSFTGANIASTNEAQSGNES